MLKHITVGGNNTDLTEMNRSLIVRILQQRGVCSRAELAVQTGLTQAAITKIVAALINIGIVAETGSVKGKGGRRSIGLRLNAEGYKVIGVKFARQTVSLGVFDISGELYEQIDLLYERGEEPRQVLSDVKSQIESYRESYRDIVAMGVAVPGPYLRKQGQISVVTSTPQWHNINFREEFEKKYPFHVRIEHDANAGALAEWFFGSRIATAKSMVYFLLGEGVGSGVIERGEILLGKLGTAAEVGHISIDVNGPLCECGNHGCLEIYCSSNAVQQKVRREYPELLRAEDKTSRQTCERVFAFARNGDAKAQSIVNQIAAYIGYGCVTLINAYNPDVIAIGDILSSGMDLMMPIVKKTVDERVFSDISQATEIRLTSLTIDPILQGAAAIAADEVLMGPSAFQSPTIPEEKDEDGGKNI